METWPSYDFIPIEDDFFLNQSLDIVPSFDLSGYHAWDLEVDQECFLDGIPYTESYLPTFPVNYPAIQYLPNSINSVQENLTSVYEDAQFGIWNQMNNVGSFEINKNQDLALHCPINNQESNADANLFENQKVDAKWNDEKTSSTKMLTKEVISQYYYMPITQAAKELSIGLTLFKKRCRELGIRRWPHRKLMSLQTLIKNVQELEKDEGDVGEGKVISRQIEILEQERKIMEQRPDVQFDGTTKRLRQACFKANYKKRKLLEMNSIDYQSPNSSSSDNNCSSRAEGSFNYGSTFEEEEELRSLLYDSDQSFSSSHHSLLF